MGPLNQVVCLESSPGCSREKERNPPHLPQVLESLQQSSVTRGRRKCLRRNCWMCRDPQPWAGEKQESDRRSAFGIKELRETTQSWEGTAGGWKEELLLDPWNVRQPGWWEQPWIWEQDDFLWGMCTGMPRGYCSPATASVGSSSSLPSTSVFPSTPVPRGWRALVTKSSPLASSQRREAEPSSRVGTSFIPRALRLRGTNLQHLIQNQSFLLKFQGLAMKSFMSIPLEETGRF